MTKEIYTKYYLAIVLAGTLMFSVTFAFILRMIFMWGLKKYKKATILISKKQGAGNKKHFSSNL